LQQAHQSDRQAKGDAKELQLGRTPEPPRVQRHRRATHTSPGELEHKPCAHGAADHVDAGQFVVVEEASHGIGQCGDGHLAAQRWRLTEAGQIDGDHLWEGPARTHGEAMDAGVDDGVMRVEMR